MNSPKGPSLRQSFIAGAAWMTATRWGLRLLGLVNTAILARVLAPSDFGLAALAMVVVAFIEVWFWLGVETALIQNKDATPEDYNSAWTLRLIQGALVAIFTIGISNLAAEFFHEPRLAAVLWVLAPAILVVAANNIGMVKFQKEINFRVEFLMTLGSKVLSVVVTILLSFWFRNYWALVWGIFSGYFVTFVLSYVVHPYRPRLCWTRVGAMWAFSKWVMVGNLATFANQKIDELIVGKMFTPHVLGTYSVALDLGQMVTNELARPINRVLFPVLSRMQDDLGRMRYSYVKAVGGVNTVTLPAGVGLALVANEAILVLLGDKWLEAVPYLQVFAIYGAARFIYSGAPGLFTALGRVKVLSALLWAEALVFVGLAVIGGLGYGVIGVALSRLVTAGVIGIATVYLLHRIGRIAPGDLGRALWRPAVSTLAMALALVAVGHFTGGAPMLVLTLSVVVGVVIYCAALLCLWLLSGKPDGVESLALGMLRSAMGKRPAAAEESTQRKM